MNEEGCSCHISPPCTYCTSHGNCEKCDAVVDNDDMIEVDGCWICQDCNLESQEAIILGALVEAWDTFVLLESTHPDDLTDFRRAIHECQRIMAVRQLRRINPDVWISRGGE